MINKVVVFSIHHKLVILLITILGCMVGAWSLMNVPLDALPDLSDTQVIVYSRWDRSPDMVEAQVTYPIVSAMLGAPGVKSVRGISDFGYSYVYVIFDDNTDLYWARSRTQEYLSPVMQNLPPGAKTELGPDATGLGWVYQYALIDDSGKHSLADLRSYQDWYLRYYLKSVPGVSEVASVGGFGRQYQVNIDPVRLQGYGIPLSRVVEAVRGTNSESSGRLIEFGGAEYMIRGRGYAQSIADFEDTVVVAKETGAAIRIKDIGQVTFGPDMRRGVTDFDGAGEAVSGIVVMRHGENALGVIQRVKKRLDEIKPGLPAGVRVVPVYDRSELVERAIRNTRTTVLEVIVTVAVVILLFLWHIPSAIIPVITIPVAVLIAFIPFHLTGMSANIMSLAGIAIAIGTLVDASIVVVEQTHKKLELWNEAGRPGDYRNVVIEAIKEVAGPSFLALLVIAVSFLPVLTLEAQEGRLFKPLAYTKTLAMVVGAVLAITLDPALRMLLMRVRPFQFRPHWLCRFWNAVAVGSIRSEERHPITGLASRLYAPVVRWSLRWKWAVTAGAGALVLLTVPIFFSLGSEFMPPLDEGSLLYMPSTMPGISIAEAQRLLQSTDRIIRNFPEVDRVFGKAGRAESATDPAPLSMLETVITLKPKSEWRRVPTWYSFWAPEWLKPLLRHATPDHIPLEKLIDELHAAVRTPGLSNAWTMPVKGRIEMLTTGIRTPVGLKVSGADPKVIDRIAKQIESRLSAIEGTRSVLAERIGAGYFLDFEWKREELAQYGLTIDEAQVAVQNAVGGENVTTTVEERERYPVNVRYMRRFRSDREALSRVLVSARDNEVQIPISELADIKLSSGPSMLRNEDGLLTGYVYVDLAGVDPGTYIDRAANALRDGIDVPPGYAVTWSGQYEAMERVTHRLRIVIPCTVFLIALLLYLNTRSFVSTCIVALAVPFSLVGAVWFLYLLGYNMSVGVWIGILALLGVDAETGVFMLLYLDLAYQEARKSGRLASQADLRQAIVQGAAKRLRPKFMTVATMLVGLVPIMWATGTGADVMKRIAAPMIGGIVTSFLLELLVYPAIYEICNWDLSQRLSPRRAIALKPMLQPDTHMHA